MTLTAADASAIVSFDMHFSTPHHFIPPQYVMLYLHAASSIAQADIHSAHQQISSPVEPEGLLPCPEEPSIGPYTEPVQPIPHPLHPIKVHLIIEACV